MSIRPTNCMAKLMTLSKYRPFESERRLICSMRMLLTATKISAFLAAFAILLLPVVSCGGCPAMPSVSSISPNSAIAGGDGFVLTVNGGSFSSNAVVVWDGSPLTTSFVSSNQLTATISATQLATPDTAVVYVYNPLPGTQTVNSTSIVATSSNGCGAKGSNAVSFTVSQ
jgi:IPT/TIG domain